MRPGAQSGLSAVELLVVIAVVAILFGAGIPAFNGLVQDMRRVTAVNALVGHVQLARSEAARRNAAVTLCPTVDGWQCAGSGADWAGGWLVFAAHHPASPTQLVSSEHIIAVHRPRYRGTIHSNRQAYVFRYGLRSTNGSLFFCDPRGPEQARAVIISHTGRPRTSTRTAGGAPIACG